MGSGDNQSLLEAICKRKPMARLWLNDLKVASCNNEDDMNVTAAYMILEDLAFMNLSHPIHRASDLLQVNG